jgi:hypothetical protein
MNKSKYFSFNIPKPKNKNKKLNVSLGDTDYLAQSKAM